MGSRISFEQTGLRFLFEKKEKKKIEKRNDTDAFICTLIVTIISWSVF